MPALDAATNAQARVGVVETNAVTKLDTNAWEVGSHSAFLTAESDPEFAANGVAKSDTNAWVVSSHDDMARALYVGGTNYLIESTSYPNATNRTVGFRRGYAGAPLPPPDPTPHEWEDVGALSMTRETVYDWYYYTNGAQVAHNNTDTYHWTGEAAFFDIPLAVFSSRLSASDLDVGTGYFNALYGDG
jgi:hypothetical protein